MPPLGIFATLVVFAIGMGTGWRFTRPSSGDVIVGWRELWRHGGADPARYRPNPKRMRVAVAGFAGFLVAFGVRFLGSYLDSEPINIVSFGGVAFSVGLVWGAVWFGGVLKSG